MEWIRARKNSASGWDNSLICAESQLFLRDHRGFLNKDNAALIQRPGNWEPSIWE